MGLKNIELKLWSKIIIVIPLARTGIDKINSIDVTMIDQQYNDKLFIYILFEFIFTMEIVKFIDLKIDDIPFKCNDKIIMLIDVLF